MNTTSNSRSRLKKGRERSVILGHPWIYSGAVDRWEGAPPALGATVDVLACGGEWLGRGLAAPAATLPIRLVTRNPEQPLDPAWLRAALARAIRYRQPWQAQAAGTTTAWRLVYAESDGLPGLVVDQYADALVVQLSAAAWMARWPDVMAALREQTGLERIVVQPDHTALAREGAAEGEVAALATAAPGGPVTIRENGFQFRVDLAGGQKTGFFLDQRDNRRRVAAHAAGQRVLSAYCYTGAFEVYMAAAGAAAILGMDRSAAALDLAREHHRMNPGGVVPEYRPADVGRALRELRDRRESFDYIVLDPPRFVALQAQKDKGLRAYKDINLLALKLLTPGGWLATFSCSGLVTAEDFKRMLAWAAADAGRRVTIVETLAQPPDHPILAGFPESEYLKGLICRVD